jgi:hypothetical protein
MLQTCHSAIGQQRPNNGRQASRQRRTWRQIPDAVSRKRSDVAVIIPKLDMPDSLGFPDAEGV